MPEVDLQNISHRYGSHTALDNVSVQFREGKITAIIGRSGSGKTTLLRSINGLISPLSGTVRVLGTAVSKNNIIGLRRRIGYVVQGNGLFPHLTVFQNISVPGKISTKPEAHFKEKATALLKLVDLPDRYLDRYPRELSGGEQQRVAICRALFLDPPVLLMDEPFASLDPVTRREVGDQLLKIRNTASITIILVTHDVAGACRLADDILVLDRGLVQQYGTVNEIISHPATPAVKQLIELR